MSEILVIVAIILGIIMLPRLTGKRAEKAGRQPIGISRMTGWARLTVMASILWPAVITLYIKPWNDHWPMFFCIAVGPVALLWGIFWVLLGFRREK